MTFINYKNRNNIVAQLEAGVLASATTIQLQTGQGAQFGNSFPMKITLEKIETISGVKVVTSREIATITARTGDILTIERATEDCIQNDTIQPPAYSNNALDFAPGDVVSHRLVASDLRDVKDKVEEIIEPTTSDFVFKTNVDQTIDGIKTFTNHPRQTSYIAPTLNQQYTPKKYVDDSISLASTPESLGTSYFVAGENIGENEVVFLEGNGKIYNSINELNIGDTSSNTRIFLGNFGSGVSSDFLYLKLGYSGNPLQNLSFRIETDNLGLPSGDLVDPLANGSITTTDFGQYNVLGTNTLDGTFVTTGDTQDIKFNNDGSRIIIANRNNLLEEYSLSINYDITSTKTFLGSYSVSGQTSFLSSFCFKSDGSGFFITEKPTSSPFFSGVVHEYNVSLNYSVSSGVITYVGSYDFGGTSDIFYLEVIDGGNTLVVLNKTESSITKYYFLRKNNITSGLIKGESIVIGGNIGSFKFSSLGDKLFVNYGGGVIMNEVREYSLSSNFSLNGATLSGSWSNSGFLRIFFNNIGDKLYGIGNDVFQYSLGGTNTATIKVNLNGSFVIPKGEFCHIVINKNGDNIDGLNYYKIYTTNEDTKTRGGGFYNGTIYNKNINNSYFLSSSIFESFVVGVADSSLLYKITSIGYSKNGYTRGEQCLFLYSGLITGLSGIIEGKNYYTGYQGQISTIPNSGYVGYGIDSKTLLIDTKNTFLFSKNNKNAIPSNVIKQVIPIGITYSNGQPSTETNIYQGKATFNGGIRIRVNFGGNSNMRYRGYRNGVSTLNKVLSPPGVITIGDLYVSKGDLIEVTIQFENGVNPTTVTDLRFGYDIVSDTNNFII